EYRAFAPAEERGDLVGEYVVVKTDDGDYLTHTMPSADIYAIRDRSSAWKAWKSKPKSGPWVTDEEQMILKTVVKQAAKYWPRRERLDQSIDYVNTGSGEG
ncbi:recombinase RecT, partial [Morganella morganii]|uniref:recombinase RecT n=1 Tax=Morganella morganii TaxID=582 RepID=UPI0015F73ED3